MADEPRDRLARLSDRPPPRRVPRTPADRSDRADRPDRSDRPDRTAVSLRERPASSSRTGGRAAAGSSGTSSARSSARSSAGARPSRASPASRAAPAAPSTGHRVLRIGVVVLSVLVLALSGTAWAALAGGLTTSSGALSALGDAPDGATDILLVGTDSRTDSAGRPLPRAVLDAIGASAEDGVLNTDTMILVRVPNDGSRAVAFSIPRDSYVPVPGTTRRDKINSFYPGAKAAAADRLVAGGDTDPTDVDVRSSEAGRAALISAVSGLTGLTVDHYAEVNLLGFYTLTQAVGGVDVCLKNPVDDDKSGAHFPAGPRTVSGHDALAFVRQRYGLPNGDLDRIRRQQAFLAALSRKVLSAGTLADPVTLTRLLDAVKQSVVLDGNWDLLRFAQQMQGISAGSVAFLTIPTRGTDNTGQGDVLLVDPGEVQRFVADAIGDGQKADPGGPDPASVPVDVRNASERDGAAARVVGVLSARGFIRSVSGNADPTTNAAATRSVVLAGPGAEPGAGMVAQALGLGSQPDPTVPAGTVRVVLGPDYAGPGAMAGPGLATSDDQTPAPPAPPPITAAGVPCVD